MCDLLGQEENSTSPVAPLLDGNKEIEKYLDSRHSAEEMTLFGLLDTKEGFLPCVVSVASSIVCIPASNAPVERVFSRSEVARGKRNCLSDDSLERETATQKQNLFVLKFNVSLPCISWSNFALEFIFYFASTKTRTIELGLDVKLELELEKQTA